MNRNKEIEHKGIIIEKEGNLFKVSVLAQSACAACHLRGACNISDIKEKIITVPSEAGFNKGDEVTVYMQQETGFKALAIGYIYPLILLLLTLFISLSISADEGLAGILSLAVLLPYYGAVYLMRNKLKRTFSFFIRN